MPDYQVSTDVDNLLKSADNAAAKTSLGLGTAADAATEDFATFTQGQTADSALQPADPTLATVTSNGATTASNITVGGRLATGNNTAVGANSTAIGGIGNSATGSSSEVLGGDVSTASGTGGTVVGGSNITNRANWTATLGGLNHDVLSSANRGAIVGGYDNHLNHADSIILGGNNITTDATNTVFVPNLKVDEGFKMPTGASDTYVLTSDANGVGTWQAAGGGGGSSIVASYVDNAFAINKPTSADVIVPVTGLSYEMQSGTTYYVKLFVLSETSLSSNEEFIYLSHTPWAATGGVKEGLVGKHWNDIGRGYQQEGVLRSGMTEYGGRWYEQSASRHYTAYLGSTYAGFSQIEGYITAPSTATFTPTISYLGTPTGSINVRVQGMIMEMP
jgi:hypothetical protein